MTLWLNKCGIFLLGRGSEEEKYIILKIVQYIRKNTLIDEFFVLALF